MKSKLLTWLCDSSVYHEKELITHCKQNSNKCNNEKIDQCKLHDMIESAPNIIQHR